MRVRLRARARATVTVRVRVRCEAHIYAPSAGGAWIRAGEHGEGRKPITSF